VLVTLDGPQSGAMGLLAQRDLSPSLGRL